MSRPGIDDFSPSASVRELNPALFGAASPPAEKCPRPDDGAGEFEGKERDLQAACERWLKDRGYMARTVRNLEGGERPRRGYFVHVHRAEKNPILLDLVLLGNDGRFLEVELKTKKGRLSPAQSGLLSAWAAGNNRPDVPACVVRSLDQFAGVVKDWEAAGEDG